MDAEPPPPVKPRYHWPWFVLAAFLLAIVLAVLWMSVAVRHLHEYREPYMVPSAEKPAAPTTASTNR